MKVFCICSVLLQFLFNKQSCLYCYLLVLFCKRGNQWNKQQLDHRVARKVFDEFLLKNEVVHKADVCKSCKKRSTFQLYQFHYVFFKICFVVYKKNIERRKMFPLYCSCAGNSTLSKRGVNVNPSCPMYSNSNDSILHLVRDCPIAISFWNRVGGAKRFFRFFFI